MRTSKNILMEKEMELVSLLMQDCESTGDIQTKLKRLFAGTIEQMLEAEMEEHLGYENIPSRATTAEIAATGTIARQLSVITARAELLYHVIAMVNSNPRYLKNVKFGLMKLSKK